MKLNHTLIRIMILCLLLVSACSSPADDNNTLPNETQGNLIDTSANSAEKETPTGDYWDGGDYPGQSVYSLTQGISQAAHDAFNACGLHDNNIEHAVESYQQQNAERQMVIAQNSQQETTWSVAMTVTPLTADVFELSCSIVE